MSEIEAAEQHWQMLADRVEADNADVSFGRMMSAPALTFQGKVFVFFTTKGGIVGLGCRLGRDFPFETLEVGNWKHLAPFKTKPPMKDWIVVGIEDKEYWHDLALAALDVARKAKK